MNEGLLKPLVNVDDHKTKLTPVNRENGTLSKVMVTCSCGAEWSHGPHASFQGMQETYNAHVKYFNRKTEVL